MVEAGEASGALAEILSKVAGYFESSVKLTKKVKSAMTYPIAVIGLAIALVNVLLIFVIPVFADMFKDFGAKLPAPTRMLIDVSDFLKHNFFYILIVCYGIFWTFKKVHLHAEGPADEGHLPRPRPDLREPRPQDRAVALLPHLRHPDPLGRADPPHPRDRVLGQRHVPGGGRLRRDQQARQPGRPGLRGAGRQRVFPADDEAHGQGG